MVKRRKHKLFDLNDKTNHALNYRTNQAKPDKDVQYDEEKRVWGLNVRLVVLSAFFASGIGFILLYLDAAKVINSQNTNATNRTRVGDGDFTLSLNYSFVTNGINIRHRPSREEFVKYFDGQTPILIQGVIVKWPAMKWNNDFLTSHYGDQQVAVVRVEGELSDAEVTVMTLKSFSQLSFNGQPSKWHYLQDELFINKHDQLKADIEEPIYFKENFFKLFPEEIRPWDAMLLWGSAHSRSYLHIDPYNWTGTNAVLRGRKRWKLFPPGQDDKLYVRQNQMCGFPLNCRKYNSPIDSFNVDYAKYPLFRNVSYIEFEQNAGELLIIPPGWFHQAYNPIPSIAISNQIMNSQNYDIVLKEIIAVNKLITNDLPDDFNSFTPKEKVQLILSLLPEEILEQGRYVNNQVMKQFYGNH